MIDPSVTPPEAKPAATLVVMRDRADGPPDILMVERAGVMAFAPGAMVFPGGRVDPGDHDLARTLALPDLDEGAARIAAIRETIEEAGLPVGFARPVDAAAITTIRTMLGDGSSFGEALRATDATLNLDALVPFARWRPHLSPIRRYDTRFYLANLPPGAPAPRVDGTENVRLCWSTAQAVLDDADAGRLALIFPTRRNLERLALFSSHAAAVAHARSYPVRVVVPWSEVRDGEEYLCIPDDLGYPVTAERSALVRRG
ncbi:MAG: NUDIX domain-containing protein [Sphingomonas phyllosphaerae]|uniref:NUDIX hydrolase n=1 Tax=Sphingomonas phyllosphaerae TaxID=257003 RepID=UPI002FF8D25B